MSWSSLAWVPDDDPSRDWSVAAQLASSWVNARCAEQGASGLLVTNTIDYLGLPDLDDFERRHARTSRRAGRSRVGPGIGPVLSYVPHAEELEFAMQRARGSSLAVVETASFPLAGWAAWLAAWNLLRNAPTPEFPEPMKELVERLVFYGNNGFGDDFGKKRARTILTNFGDQVRQERDGLLGAVLAAGVSACGVANLGRLMDKL